MRSISFSAILSAAALRSARTILAALVLALLPFTAAEGASAPPNEWERCLTFDPDTGEPRIDALCFFDALVDRYRSLTAYEDVAKVTQVTERAGEAPTRVETKIGSTIEDGRLRVQTAASEARRRLGLTAGPRMSPAMEAIHHRYNLWLAPHMALKFEDRPQRDFRSGVRQGFVATEAAAVTIDDRTLVHLELTSADGTDDDPGARFDLFVNPDSMLVERIEGEQTLPDGARFETRLDITTTHAVAAEPASVAPDGDDPLAPLVDPPADPAVSVPPAVFAPPAAAAPPHVLPPDVLRDGA